VRRNWPICSTGSTGGTRFARGVQRRLAEGCDASHALKYAAPARPSIPSSCGTVSGDRVCNPSSSRRSRESATSRERDSRIAVWSEPVSGPNFPVSWENTGNSNDSRLKYCDTASNPCAMSITYKPISLPELTRNFLQLKGNFGRLTGN
jgi:hypothetical protein